MKLVLVDTPELKIMTPAGNALISVIGANAVNSVVVISDPTIKVDNFNVCTRITINCTYQAGPSSVPDVVVINGTSVCSTANHQPMITIGDMGSGAVVKATVISCGQTSTMVD